MHNGLNDTQIEIILTDIDNQMDYEFTRLRSEFNKKNTIKVSSGGV
jgi:hypothetical protein